ncbi:MAG: hypothetical protein ABI597_14075 [Gammaproteobacteria bacterium]
MQEGNALQEIGSSVGSVVIFFIIMLFLDLGLIVKRSEHESDTHTQGITA